MGRTWRATVAVAMLLGVFLLALGIVAVTAWVVLLALPHGSRAALVGEVAAVTLVAAGGFAFLLQRRSRTRAPVGTPLEPEDQPLLWTEVHQAAKAVDTRAPDEIRLVGEVDVAVAEEPRVLGLVGGHRTLYLGVPSVLGLTRQQLRAALAHELGHYSSRYTALAGITARGRAAMSQVVHRTSQRSPFAGIARAYAALYLAVTSSTMRQQEQEADDLSAEVAGRDGVVSWLSETPVVQAAWEHYVEEHVAPAEAAGRRPDELYEGFMDVLEAPPLQEALASFREGAHQPEPSRYDGHPPLGERIARLRARPADDVAADPAPALELLADPIETLHALQEWVYKDTTLEPTPWRELRTGPGHAGVRAARH